MPDAGAHSARHRAVAGASTVRLAPDARPIAGPIAVLPHPETFFVDAVRQAGGTVARVDAQTRGLVWLLSSGADELVSVLRDHPEIGWLQLPWAGVDRFAPVFPIALERGMVVTSAKGSYAQPVAEHALALTLALLREIPMRAAATEWGTKAGRSLYGANVVIVGAGGIALELVRLLEPFGARVTIVRRSQEDVAGVARTVTVQQLSSVLGDADVLVLAAALSEQTAGLLGAAEFARMKSDAVLVNVARGRLVDTDALVNALHSGAIAAAGLDVTDPEPLPPGHPLWSEPRALITPHSADTPEMTDPLLADRLRANVQAFLGDGTFEGLVDLRVGY